jgi:hypothetical protein
MPKYKYLTEAVSDTTNSETYRYGEADSLRAALEWLRTEAESNSDAIDIGWFRNKFRIRTMVKVGSNHTNQDRIESRYAVYRYPADNVPETRPAFP